MSQLEMTADQAISNITRGIEATFKAAIKLELEKQAKPIIEAAADRLASAIVTRLDTYKESHPFGKTLITIRIDGVEKVFDPQAEA